MPQGGPDQERDPPLSDAWKVYLEHFDRWLHGTWAGKEASSTKCYELKRNKNLSFDVAKKDQPVPEDLIPSPTCIGCGKEVENSATLFCIICSRE